MTLEELLNKLKTLKYKSDLFGKITEFNVLNNENFGMVENLIREYALDNHDSEMGELKAKLYVYEQIIAKSNFAPFVDDIRQKLKEVEKPNYHFGCGEQLSIKAALHDCKLVFDGIIDDDTYQEADKGLVMYYANEIIYALRLAAELEKE